MEEPWQGAARDVRESRPEMTPKSAFIVAARRTALGKPGGLHRQRRLGDLAAPVVSAVLDDAKLSPARVEQMILGNTTESGNPARLVSLAAGLPESARALTLDMQGASGLAAIVDAARQIGAGDAEIVVAGGAEAISMAPWRIAKPRGVHQTPRFIGLGAGSDEDGVDDGTIEAMDRAAAALGIGREKQDEYAFRSHLAASLARDARRFVKEIVPLRASADEGRDQSAVEPGLDDLAAMAPLRADGTATAGNISLPHDGAAFAVVVSHAVWEELGKPQAMQILSWSSAGVALAEEIEAPAMAMRRLLARSRGLTVPELDLIELGEASASQAIAFRDVLGISDGTLNPDGGAVVRGNPLGASGAVQAARLFTRMARSKQPDRARLGAAIAAASGGLAIAALFEAV